jgi:hypothetical protein
MLENTLVHNDKWFEIVIYLFSLNHVKLLATKRKPFLNISISKNNSSPDKVNNQQYEE